MGYCDPSSRMLGLWVIPRAEDAPHSQSASRETCTGFASIRVFRRQFRLRCRQLLIVRLQRQLTVHRSSDGFSFRQRILLLRARILL